MVFSVFLYVLPVPRSRHKDVLESVSQGVEYQFKTAVKVSLSEIIVAYNAVLEKVVNLDFSVYSSAQPLPHQYALTDVSPHEYNLRKTFRMHGLLLNRTALFVVLLVWSGYVLEHHSTDSYVHPHAQTFVAPL